jgi:hypothetical protein
MMVEEDEIDEGSDWNLDLDFVFNAIPAALLINAQENLSITADDGAVSTLSTVYMMPNFSAGVGFSVKDAYVDVTAGAGIIANDAFRSFLLQAGVAATWEASPSFEIGPKLGVMYFPNPEWTEEEDVVDVDGSWGYTVGVMVSLGDKVSYLLSVDWIGVEFDMEATDAGYTLEQDTLELGGLAVQFGVRGVF